MKKMQKNEKNIHVQTPRFDPITDEEADHIIGGLDDPINGGLCGIAGFACNKKGGLKVGVCVIVGIAWGLWTPIGGKKAKKKKSGE